MQRPMMGQPMGMNRMANEVNPENCMEYRKYRQMGDEICQALEQARSGGKQPAGAAPEENIIMREAAQDIPAAGPWTCPACGGANTGRFCEYCGSGVKEINIRSWSFNDIKELNTQTKKYY